MKRRLCSRSERPACTGSRRVLSLQRRVLFYLHSFGPRRGCRHTKLYRFDSAARQWRLRGKGWAYIKHNPKAFRYRFLFREDATHIVRANHDSTCVGMAGRESV